MSVTVARRRRKQLAQNSGIFCFCYANRHDATPKETKYVSNIDYFGEPIYTYSLKEGIEDGFLAPFKVINVMTDIGEDGVLARASAIFTEMKSKIVLITNSDYDYNIIIEDSYQSSCC